MLNGLWSCFSLEMEEERHYNEMTHHQILPPQCLAAGAHSSHRSRTVSSPVPLGIGASPGLVQSTSSTAGRPLSPGKLVITVNHKTCVTSGSRFLQEYFTLIVVKLHLLWRGQMFSLLPQKAVSIILLIRLLQSIWLFHHRPHLHSM